MSWNASAHVLKLAEKYPELTLTQMAVLYALAARHNHEYHCAFGTLKRIAGDAHVHQVTVSSTVTELEGKGLLSVYEGQIPRKKSDPMDRRFTRGTLWCFVGLDPDDGPDIEGVVARVRTSGRPPTESISQGLNQLGTSISPELSDELAETENELAGGCASISRNGGDELAGLNSPFKAGFKPDSTRSVEEPEEKPASARAPDEAPPRRAADDEPDGAAVPPMWEEIAPGVHRGTPGGRGEITLFKVRCPLCATVFTTAQLEAAGSAQPEHDCVPIGDKLRSDAEAQRFGNIGGFLPRRRRRDPVPEAVKAELAAMEAASRDRPPAELSSDLLAEHRRYLERSRQPNGDK